MKKFKFSGKEEMKRIKGFFGDFKKFISRGNILDMAVGVIIGGAFGTIVSALTNKIIMPLINLIVFACTGGKGISLITVLNGEDYLLPDGTINSACIYIDWGSFIMAILDFLIIAFVLFLILRTVMRANDMFKSSYDKVVNKQLKAERKAVRRQAKAEKRPFDEVWEEHLAEKKRVEEEQARLEAEKKAKEEEAERLAHPTTEMLLASILEELRKQNSSTAIAVEKKIEAVASSQE